ncbi:hypothetical protein CDL15_Pgr003148 [Punica granatum]|nr:hypothetical protein CDL15_Pgr003148 [Punica granatum]
MPGLAAAVHQRNDQFSNAASANGFWSRHRDDVGYNQLQKFWNDLSPQARQDLLKIDKQTLFEQARKNMYCSRCNGLLLEGFLQIVMYGKSFQQEGAIAHISYNISAPSKSLQDGGMCTSNGCQDEIQDPSVHPWGGLSTTRDGSLTLLDCYIFAKSLKGLQIVFDSARVRERERELLYPDACGGGGRGWISQGIASYGRGHGMRETCALHTARLSCDTLVDFWSALGEETRQSLLRMKEEDFIERLMYRFDSKRFCRDCRRNVIREFKELKELKRMRREPRCTSCFCVADTAFQYEVSDDSVHADWHQTFADSVGSYHHFEWAVGTGEGKSDILEFENVGLNGSAQVTGLHLGGLNACFITLRAWKLDGRCTELFVKAHALKGQQCVHGRLVVGDGFVTITRGESIRRFFEHAEEAEEEEDDDSMDKDGNELDGECSRPQKHAKSPELAREFLLDAAIVIFKEQVEKAFREGTARQNAHSIFVCLALKLLEERVHIACKEIITFEKQMKLLEEEEKEKRDEEERKERRRMKEREKKLRRKERLKGKDKDVDKKTSLMEETLLSNDTKDKSSPGADEEPNEIVGSRDSVSWNGETVSPRPVSSDIEDEEASGECPTFGDQFNENAEVEFTEVNDGASSFTTEQLSFSHGKLKSRKEGQVDQSLKWSDKRRFAVVSEIGPMGNRSMPRYQSDSSENHSRGMHSSNRQLKPNPQKSCGRNSASKSSEKLHYANSRMNERFDAHPCGCNQIHDFRANTDLPVSAIRTGRESKYMIKSESSLDVSKHFYRGNKYNQADYPRQSGGRLKSKVITGINNLGNKDSIHFRKVWEPLESQKKCPRSNSASDVTLISSGFKAEGESSDSTKSSGELCSSEDSGDSIEMNHKNSSMRGPNGDVGQRCQSEPESGVADSTKTAGAVTSSCSNSDNCSSCLSEVDSNTPSSNHGNPESSSTSDSEDASQQSERGEALGCDSVSNCHKVNIEASEVTNGVEASGNNRPFLRFPIGSDGNHPDIYPPIKLSHPSRDLNSTPFGMGHKNPAMLPEMQCSQNIYLPMFQSPSNMGYYTHQNLISWAPFPASGLLPHANNYLYPGPLGYGLDANRGFCMPYEAMQHLAPPMINGGPGPFPHPAYRPVTPANGVYVEEKPQLPKQGVGQEVSDVMISQEKVVPARPAKPSEPPHNEGGKGDPSAKACQENSGFSLFHFGGPIALSNITKSSEDAAIGDISSVVPTDTAEGFHDCNKKETTIEEYNLFAASNGMRFSIF